MSDCKEFAVTPGHRVPNRRAQRSIRSLIPAPCLVDTVTSCCVAEAGGAFSFAQGTS